MGFLGGRILGGGGHFLVFFRGEPPAPPIMIHFMAKLA